VIDTTSFEYDWQDQQIYALWFRFSATSHSLVQF